MDKIEKLTMELAEACRTAGINFVIAVEDNGIHSQSSVKGKSALRELTNCLKELVKK